MSDIATLELVNKIERRLALLEARDKGYTFIPLATPLTSTSWDGDSHSTTAMTLIDLSAVFSAPAGIRAVLVIAHAKDSGSAGITDGCCFRLAPSAAPAGAGGAFFLRLEGIVNDAWHAEMGVVPCDANGDVYWSCAASGASTMDIWLEIWGYIL